jgi:hypothetical protein
VRRNWKDPNLIIEALDGASSKAEVLRNLGLPTRGSSFRTLKRWAEIHEIKLPDGNDTSKLRSRLEKPLEEILVENSTYTNTSALKKRLVREGLLNETCYNDDCDVNSPFWLGLPLTLQLEHVNGDVTDNRITNLIILCPNCHTQTSTWGTKKRDRNPSLGPQ